MYKVSDLISQFEGGEDFSEWVVKVEQVAQLQNVPNLCTFLPLFLRGGALAVYQGLDDETKSDYGLLKKALNSAFSPNPLTAYDKFLCRKLKEKESVDVYVSDLIRLADLISVNGDNDNWIKCAFIKGLPNNLKLQLNAIGNIQSVPFKGLVKRVRDMISCDYDATVNGLENAQNRFLKDKPKEQSYRCYNCQGLGHFARECPTKNDLNGQGKLFAPTASQLKKF